MQVYQFGEGEKHMLEVEKVSKVYKQHEVLQQVSFQLHAGKIIGLVGENGAGKSTLLEILATVQQPTSGSIRLNEYDYKNQMKELRRTIGFVPQELSLWEQFSVEENMRFFNQLSWKKKTMEECRELCEQMQLTKWKETVHTLSGGMKRKLNLAISLLHDPLLLLLDEPTVGIDLKSKKEIGNYLLKLAKDDGKMILYTSHDMDEIRTLCDQVFVIGNDPFYEKYLTAEGVDVIRLQ